MLRPDQIAACRSPDKLCGKTPHGQLFVVMVAADVLRRAQELADVSQGPMHWQVMDLSRAGNVPVVTTSPEWFVELDEALRAGRGNY